MFITAAWTVVTIFIAFTVIKLTVGLRVTEDEEITGLDTTEHGLPSAYAGFAIMDIAKRHNLKVVEDAAQGVMSEYKGKALGAIGDYGCYSFHETKNYSMGEGGALLIRDADNIELAEIIREKGTNRSRFLRGQIDKYTLQGL